MARIGRMYHPAPFRFCLMILTAKVQEMLRQRKAEILCRLRTTPLPPDTLSEVFSNSREQGTVSVFAAPWGWCPHCSGDRWWISLYGIRTCSTCVPPSSKDLVAGWGEYQPDEEEGEQR